MQCRWLGFVQSLFSHSWTFSRLMFDAWILDKVSQERVKSKRRPFCANIICMTLLRRSLII